MRALSLVLALTLAATVTVAVGGATDEPTPKYDSSGKVDGRFLMRHEGYKKIAAEGKAHLILLGDSITQGWQRNRALYNETFGQYAPAIFGIGGDRTEHILWRVVNGEFPTGFTPKAVMLMAGTNNFFSNSDAEIASGVHAIIRAIHERTPNTTVLLIGLFPRDFPFGDARSVNINKTLATFHNGSSIVYHNPRPWLTTPDDKFNPALFADSAHLNSDGYRAWATAIKEPLAAIMGTQASASRGY
jgi:lysophospholipase L1-like esterase